MKVFHGHPDNKIFFLVLDSCALLDHFLQYKKIFVYSSNDQLHASCRKEDKIEKVR